MLRDHQVTATKETDKIQDIVGILNAIRRSYTSIFSSDLSCIICCKLVAMPAVG